MLSDYRFVEEVTEARDSAAKRRQAAPRGGAQTLHQLPRHLQALVRGAASRGVQLVLMSPGVHRLGIAVCCSNKCLFVRARQGFAVELGTPTTVVRDEGW